MHRLGARTRGLSAALLVAALSAPVAAAPPVRGQDRGGSPPAARSGELLVSAAISLKEAMETLGPRFERAHPGVVLRCNFGGSGALQKQIEAGAPVDVFLSAADEPMNELEARGLVDRSSRRVVARNLLVVAVPADSRLVIERMSDLMGPSVRRVAIGSPRTVAAGQYAEASLRAAGGWEALRPRLVFGENVRQVLDYVARGEVEAGFVWATDIRVRPGEVRPAFRVPPETYPPATCPAAVVAASGQKALGRAFIDMLVGPQAQAALARLGFQPPGGAVR